MVPTSLAALEYALPRKPAVLPEVTTCRRYCAAAVGEVLASISPAATLKGSSINLATPRSPAQFDAEDADPAVYGRNWLARRRST
jgi:hypothetical protein